YKLSSFLRLLHTSSPLFPYTTLFRSLPVRLRECRDPRLARCAGGRPQDHATTDTGGAGTGRRGTLAGRGRTGCRCAAPARQPAHRRAAFHDAEPVRPVAVVLRLQRRTRRRVVHSRGVGWTAARSEERRGGE